MSKRYKQIKQATPHWMTPLEKLWIKELYTMAIVLTEQTLVPHSVDHYYPLMGKTVSGLHTLSNLVIIPSEVNMIKKNKHPDVFYQKDLTTADA